AAKRLAPPAELSPLRSPEGPPLPLAPPCNRQRPFSSLATGRVSLVRAIRLIVKRGELLDDNAPRSRFMIIISWCTTRSTWLPRWPVFIWSSVQTLHPPES